MRDTGSFRRRGPTAPVAPTALTALLALFIAACSSSSAAEPSASTASAVGESSSSAASSVPLGTVSPPAEQSTAPAASGELATASGTWTAGPPFTQASSMGFLACASASYCIGDSMIWDGTAWGQMPALPTGTGIEAVNCVGPTTCFAMSNDHFMTWDGLKWIEGRNFYSTGGDQGGVSIADLACVSNKLCIALDQTYGQAFAWNGKSWSDPVTVDKAVADNVAAVNAGTTYDLISPSIACASATLCVVVDSANNATSWNGSTWTPLTQLGEPLAHPELRPPVACSATWCVASINGGVTVFDGTTWSTPQGVPIPEPYPGSRPIGFEAMSCPQGGSCVATGVPTVASDWATFDGQIWQLGAARVGIQEPGPISCPTANWCMDVGPYSYATLQR